MCHCVNIAMGSYANQTILDYPEWFVSERKYRWAGIDNCLLEEIKSLWESGVQTLECCCGHNKTTGYIAVVPEHSENMLYLGYKPVEGMEGVFEPKTAYRL